MLKGQMSIFEDKVKLIKKTDRYKITKYGNVYAIHFYDKENRDKCRVTKNSDYIERFL